MINRDWTGESGFKAFVSGVQAGEGGQEVWLNPLALVECLYYQLPEHKRDSLFKEYIKTVVDNPHQMPRCADRHRHFMEYVLKHYHFEVTASQNHK